MMQIGTTDDLSRITRQLFRFSLEVSLIMMIAGLIIDWYVGYQMFQRFGALLVGIGVLHYFYAREIEAQINKYEMLEKSYKGHISRFLPCPVDPNDTKYVDALHVIVSMLKPQAGEHASFVAKVILDEVLEAERKLPLLKMQLRRVRHLEILMVIFGTIVWAFGDLLTNFFFHCRFNWSC